MHKNKLILTAVLSLLAVPALAAEPPATVSNCGAMPDHAALQAALRAAQTQQNGGIGNQMWGVIVDRSGTVCQVAYSGANLGSQWPGSRIIAAEKANTANSYSLDSAAMSTANLYAASQPGGFLYGINQTNPTNAVVATKGPASSFGTDSDPMVGNLIGGVVTFGGGLGLYDSQGRIVGGLGVSGDTACADHNVAWRTRQGLHLDHVAFGYAPDKDDQIVYDITLGHSKSGFGHPKCVGKEADIAAKLPKVEKPQANATAMK